MTAAIALAGLSVSRGGREVVRDVACTIAKGEWFGVIGANGSGKTTLLRAIAGRLPIDTGSCMILGEDLAQDRHARAQQIGFAPPIETLPAALTLRALLELAGDPAHLQQDRNAALWQALGIERLLDIRMGQCSSGMRQRGALALAFAHPCDIVILDEPFNWLDPVAAFDIRSALAAMVGEGLTLVTALHDLATLCGSCSSGMVMAKGRVSLTRGEERLRKGRSDASRFESELVAALR